MSTSASSKRESGSTESSARIKNAALGSTSTTRPAISTSTRRHSLFGTEDRIVIDLGSRIIKIGFSGESRPRLVQRSLDLATLTDFGQQNPSLAQGQGHAADANGSGNDNDTLWDLDFGKSRNDRERDEKESLLHARLIHLFRQLFSSLLMVDPKQRKIIVVENALTPTIVKETLCRVLFGNLQVPSVSFIPSPLLCLMATGNLTGLVLSIGYHETSVTSVFSSRPMSQYTKTSSRASKRVFSRLKALLLTFARFVPPPTSLQSKPTNAKDRAVPVPEHLLTVEFLEEIVGKACLISQLTQNGKREEIESSSSSAPSSSSSSMWNPIATQEEIGLSKIDQDGTIDLEAMKSLKKRYSSQSTATNLTMLVPKPKSEINFQPLGSNSASASSSQQQQSLNSARGLLVIPGWVRESALEVLFEQGDEDECSITEVVLDSILSLPIDVRRVMIENILVSGGLASTPGFCNRVRQELVKTVDSIDLEALGSQFSIAMTSGRRLIIRHSLKEDFQDAPPPSTSSSDGKTSENEFKEAHESVRIKDGAGEEEEEEEEDESFASASTQSQIQPFSSISKTSSSKSSRQLGFKPSASSIPSLHFLKYAPLKSLVPYLAVLNDHAPKLYDDLTAQGGRTPAISPFILAWTGGSLAGALRTNAIEELTREVWDESEAALKAKDKKIERPVWSGGGKGSFLGGITGGLDTGAFGAISRLISRGADSSRIRSP